MSLAGRTTLLTGATGALGRAIAEAYCRAGALSLLSSRDEAALQALADDDACTLRRVVPKERPGPRIQEATR